jgi:hypothetical protein
MKLTQIVKVVLCFVMFVSWDCPALNFTHVVNFVINKSKFHGFRPFTLL